MSQFADAYGVRYVARRESWRAKPEMSGKERGSGFTVRRVSPRLVELKRAQRAARRAAA